MSEYGRISVTIDVNPRLYEAATTTLDRLRYYLDEARLRIREVQQWEDDGGPAASKAVMEKHEVAATSPEVRLGGELARLEERHHRWLREDAVRALERLTDGDALALRHTYGDLLTILVRYTGERGDSEGAVDTLKRIIKERDDARKLAGLSPAT